MSKDTIKLKAGGKIYEGWESVTIKKSITSLCGTFSLSVAEELSLAKYKILWGVSLGQYVEIFINDHPVMLGWVDSIGNQGSKKSHSITVAGRSLLSDVVDCSYMGSKVEWLDTSLEPIVTALCAGFPNVYVDVEGNLANYHATTYPFPQVAVQPGDTVFNLIKKLCSQRAVLPLGGIFDVDGHREYLTLATAGENRSKDALISGVPKKAYFRDIGHNILSWNVQDSNVDRFSQYTIKGTAPNADPVNSQGGLEADLVTAPQGVALDTGIKRYRPLVIMSEGPGNQSDMKHKADWESMLRAGKSRRVSYTVQGWTTREGMPWEVNLIIPVRDPIGGIDADLLLDSVTFSKSLSGGTTTGMELVHPATYAMPTPTIEAGDIKTGFDPLTSDPGA